MIARCRSGKTDVLATRTQDHSGSGRVDQYILIVFRERVPYMRIDDFGDGDRIEEAC